MVQNETAVNAPASPAASHQNGRVEGNEYEKLKHQNDAFEQELIRARTMRAEMQKLEAEKMMAGTAGGHVEQEKPKVESAKDYAARVMNNKV